MWSRWCSSCQWWVWSNHWDSLWSEILRELHMNDENLLNICLLLSFGMIHLYRTIVPKSLVEEYAVLIKRRRGKTHLGCSQWNYSRIRDPTFCVLLRATTKESVKKRFAKYSNLNSTNQPDNQIQSNTKFIAWIRDLPSHNRYSLSEFLSYLLLTFIVVDSLERRKSTLYEIISVNSWFCLEYITFATALRSNYKSPTPLFCPTDCFGIHPHSRKWETTWLI